LETLLNRNIALTSFEAVHVDKIGEEDWQKVLSSNCEVTCLAALNEPKNFKVKRYNEKLNAGVKDLLTGIVKS